jgi:TolB-like protein
VETIVNFLGFLWRHRIVRVAIAYVAAGWLAFQVALNVSQGLQLPDWIPKFTLVALALAFAPALILAWAWRPRPAQPEAEPEAEARKAPTRGELAVVAVLPFANFSRNPADEMFADGIVEDLITGLSLNSGLRVISRSSTFAYKGRSPDVREVGADLGADFVLEGSVRRAGDRLRVTAQLIEARNGGHVWAEQYDRPVNELFALQDDLVLAIASALNAEIDRADLIRARNDPASVSAWEEAWRSAALYERPSLAELPASIAHARRSIEIDPQFPMGHARLAMALATAVQMKGEPRGGPLRAESVAHVRRAVALAPNDPRILGMACSTLAHAGEAQEGLRHGLRALELNPNDATVHGSVGNALFRSGHPAEALPYYEEEERLAPRSIWLNGRYLYRGLAQLALGRPDEAAKALSRTTDGDPSFEQAWAARAATEAVRGDMAAAVEAITRLRELNPTSPLSLWTAALDVAVQGPLNGAAVEGFRAAWIEAGGPAT